MLSPRSYKVIRLLCTISILLMLLVFAGPAQNARAGGGGVNFTISNVCHSTGYNVLLAVAHVNPPGTYAWHYTVDNLTTGVSVLFGSASDLPADFPLTAGAVFINAGDVVRVVLTIEGISQTFYPCSAAPLAFSDGRCNQEADQTVAVYPDGKNGYIFYAINNSIGYFAMHVTAADLKANPDKDTAYLIRENMGVRLYRLAGGDLQVNRVRPDGTDYVFDPGTCGLSQF